MAEDNEIQILLTAVDNASDEIQKVNDKLGGLGGSGGLTEAAGEAKGAVDNLSKGFDEMTLAELRQVKQLSLTDDEFEKYTDALVKAEAAAKAGTVATEAATKATGLYGMSLGATVAIGVVATGVVASIAASFIAVKSAGDFATKTLGDVANATEEDIKVAREYKIVMDDVTKATDVLKDIAVAAWYEIGRSGARAILYIKSILGEGFNFPELGEVGMGIHVTDMTWLEKLEAAAKKIQDANYSMGKSFAFTYDDITKRITEKELEIAEALGQGWSENSTRIQGLREELGNLEGQLDRTQKQFVLDMFAMKMAADGVAGDEALQKYLAMAVKLGLISQAAADATLDMLGLGGSIDALHDKTVNVTVTTTYLYRGKDKGATSDSGSGSSTTTTSSSSSGGGSGWTFMGNDVDGFAKGPLYYNSATGAYKIGSYASGGQFSGWGVVGDNKDGSWNSTTELVHAPQGAQVFSNQQSQSMAKGGMGGFASGGMIGEGLIDYDKMARVLRDVMLQVIQ